LDPFMWNCAVAIPVCRAFAVAIPVCRVFQHNASQIENNRYEYEYCTSTYSTNTGKQGCSKREMDQEVATATRGRVQLVFI
jgi:hypothetical protein